MGVSFAIYVSTLLIVFEKSRTEPVSPREWRTVASFMEKAGRVIGVSGGFELELVWMTTYFMNCILSMGRNTKPMQWSWSELRKEWIRRRARMVLNRNRDMGSVERAARGRGRTQPLRLGTRQTVGEIASVRTPPPKQTP